MKKIVKALMSAVFIWLTLVLLPAPGLASSCFECHKPSEFQGAVVHQPVAEKRCDQCHDPHVARHEGLLVMAQRELCQGCHEPLRKRMENSSFLHQPVKEGNCGGRRVARQTRKGTVLWLP